MRPWTIPAMLVLLAGLAASGDVFAGPNMVSGVTCPATSARNRTITAVVSLRNENPQSVAVSRGALLLHLGNVRLIGPLAFSVTTTIPAATTQSTPPFATVPGTTTVSVPVLIPAQARPGTFVSVGLGFFGNIGGNPTRERLGHEGCVIEIVP